MGHPARFNARILEAIAPDLARIGLPVHDPFAGTGERLGQLCDRLGLPFTGTEIEPEFIVDPRVSAGDSTEARTYPTGPFMVATSPVYPNGMTDHFCAKDGSKRHTYRQGLAEILGHDRPLHENNMGRWGSVHRRGLNSHIRHWDIARACIRHWPKWVVVNVKDVRTSTYVVPVVEQWPAMLEAHDYHLRSTSVIPCPGQRHGANGHLRVDAEVALVMEKETKN